MILRPEASVFSPDESYRDLIKLIYPGIYGWIVSCFRAQDKTECTRRLCNLCTGNSGPGYGEFALVFSTVTQIQVNQRLIGYATVGCLFLKVINCFSIQINRDLAFQFFCVRVWPCVGEIIFQPQVLSPPSDIPR